MVHPDPARGRSVVVLAFDRGRPPPTATVRVVKLLRRALGALLLAGTIAAAMRTRGKGGVPPQEGGWREVSIPPE